jgi:peptide-methionine (S)-S-oxide reductase
LSTGQEIVTKVRPLEMFYEAEDYHQNYWNTKGSENAYCSIIPGKLAKLQTLFKDYYVEST